jgi:hypothetical protein
MFDHKFVSDLIAWYAFWGCIILGAAFLFGVTAGVLIFNG